MGHTLHPPWGHTAGWRPKYGQIERDVLAKMNSGIQSWRTRSLSLQGRVTVINTYLLPRIWHLVPFYHFSQDFWKEIDKMCLHLLYHSTRAHVSLKWIRQPRNKGGLGLIDPQIQAQAIKSKWMARWTSSKKAPRWKKIWTNIAHEIFGLDTKQETIDTIGSGAPVAHPRVPQDNPIAAAVKAFSDLDITAQPQAPEPGATAQRVTLHFTDKKIPVAEFGSKMHGNIWRKKFWKQHLGTRPQPTTTCGTGRHILQEGSHHPLRCPMPCGIVFSSAYMPQNGTQMKKNFCTNCITMQFGPTASNTS